MTRPIIAVPAMSSAKINGLRFAGSVVANAVIESIERAGGQPVIISPLAREDERLWDLVDGLVLPGGSDIDPARYGQQADASYAGTDFAGQDDADAAAIALAESRGIPALLICRGMQLWNVERGGTMVQHWPDDPQQHVDTIHNVAVKDGSLLERVFQDAEVLSGGQVSVSSYHHQALGALGQGLVVTARADDGAIEAIEDPEYKIVAVQWHPEDRSQQVASDQALFDWVVARANERMHAGQIDTASGRRSAAPPQLRISDVVQQTGESAKPAPGSASLRIAVIAQLNLPGQDWETYELLRRFTRVAIETLNSLGATVDVVDVTAAEEPDYTDIAAADGLLVLGGGDVDPQFYGHEGEIPNEFGRDVTSDIRQLRILREAIERDACVLAICRGSQLLNVACGGSLIADLQPSDLHRISDGTGMFKDERVKLVADTRVREIYGREEITVRSGHHQAVATPGAGLRVIARAHDGVIEGVEREDSAWIVGVQWHPEDDDGSREDRFALFSAFIEEARSRQDARAVSATV